MLDQVAELVREVAATIVMPRFRHLTEDEVHHKGPGDLVTIADQESERALIKGLTALLPGSIVVGEESAAADPDLVHRVRDAGDVWIVDPVDGTNNFASGKAPFAVMVALVRNGEPAASWILDLPVGELTVAEAGSGAYREGVRLKTRTDDPGLTALRGIVSRNYTIPDLRPGVNANARALGEMTDGKHCAGYEYGAVATDEQQFALFWRLMPWDHAPGELIVREAGGTVLHLDGSPYRPGDRDLGLLAASNDDIWHAVRDQLVPSFRP